MLTLRYFGRWHRPLFWGGGTAAVHFRRPGLPHFFTQSRYGDPLSWSFRGNDLRELERRTSTVTALQPLELASANQNSSTANSATDIPRKYEMATSFPMFTPLLLVLKHRV